MTTTHIEVRNALNPEIVWNLGYPVIAKAIREIFEASPEATYSTNDLAAMLMPQDTIVGSSGATAYQRLFRALAALSKHDLASYTSPSSVTKVLYGKARTPLVWHASKGEAPATPKQHLKRCPTCNGRGMV